MEDGTAFPDSKVFLLPKMTYKEQLAHPQWQKKRLEIFERDHFTCQTCLDTISQLQVHHKYYDSSFKTLAWEYENDAYKTLCKDCHLIEEYIKKDGQHSVIAVKKDHTKPKCLIISTVVYDVEDGLTLSIFTINRNNKLDFVINFKDTTISGFKDLLENAKKLL